jgi:hypothetical protein
VKKPSKYRNVPTEIDGFRFASKREARRYAQLKLLLASGDIAELELQPRYPLRVGGMLICTYVADFRYLEGGEIVTEDVKGVMTPAYRIKKKLMRAIYGIDVREVQ